MASSVEEYIALQQAVDRVYGTDTWLSVVGTDKYNSVGFAELMESIEGVSVNYAKDGSILGYNYNIPTNTAVYNPASIANSNITSTALKTNVSVPANTVVDSSGKVVAESGLKTVSSGSTVTATLGKVAVGVGAVAAGIQLGAAIDGALYNANPDFWDSNGMSAINPQTWDSVCSTQGGKDVFNMVFGIDKDTGETQAYIDQNALAQIAQYLAVMGAFSTSIDAVITDQEKSTLGLTNTTTFSLSNISEMSMTVGSFVYTNEITSGNAKGGWWRYATGADTTVYSLFASDAPFTLTRYRNGTVFQTINATSTILNNKRVYYAIGGNGAFASVVISGVLNYINETMAQSNLMTRLAYIIAYGSEQGGQGVAGITPQQGATTPSGIDGEMTTAEVLPLSSL